MISRNASKQPMSELIFPLVFFIVYVAYELQVFFPPHVVEEE